MRFRFVAAVVVAVLASSVRAQTFAPGGHLVVVDANGKVVGQFVPGSQFGGASVVLNGRPAVLSVRRDRLVENGELRYEQPNCQGTPFMSPIGSWELQVAVAIGPDGSAYMPSQSIGSHTILSSWNDATQQCTAANPSTYPVVTAIVGPNVKSLFTPPFALVSGEAQASVATAPINRPLLLGLLAISLAVLAVLRIRWA